MQFSIPSHRIIPIERAELRLDPRPHELELTSTEAIDAHWLTEKAARPEIHDGRIALFSRLTWEEGVLLGTCHITRYATFLYWRGGAQRERAAHLYAHAVLVAADGRLVAVRMSGHTLNAGRVYFAAGSLEPEDFPGETADLDGNMRREVLEETGFDLAELEAEPFMHALSIETGTVVFRRYLSRLSAEELAERIAAHVATEAEPEITGPVIIERPDPEGIDLSPQMPGILRWHFSGSGS